MRRVFGGKVGETGSSVEDSSGGGDVSASISAETDTRDLSDVYISESDSTVDKTTGGGSDGGVWITIKNRVGGVLSTLRGANQRSKEVIGIVPPKQEISKYQRYV